MNGLTDFDNGLIGITFILLFLLIMYLVAYIFRNRNWHTAKGSQLREIPAFKKLNESVNEAIESGKGIHFTFGRENISSIYSASTLVGLSMLGKITRLVAVGDKQPTTSSGDGSLMILSQDVMNKAYRETSSIEEYDMLAGRFTGPSPFTYASGTLPLIYDHNFSINIISGHFESEIALITEASENTQSQTIAGSDDLMAQAVIFATSSDPLIGEELYAGGAYTRVGLMHIASLHTQDVFRWLLIIIILVGSGLKFAGIL